MTQFLNCPVCSNNARNITLTSRHHIPALQNVALSHIEEANNFPVANLEMLRCSECSFVWNSHFDKDRAIYDENYNNDVSASNYYVSHLEEMANKIINSVPENEPIYYVEIGCGEGDFLNLVIEKSEGRCVSAIGFDPSFSGQDKLAEGAVVHRGYFGPEQQEMIPESSNVICSRHTIEHVFDVHSFVSSLSSTITKGDRKLFIETPTSDWILENVAFQDFFYEHCSLFNMRSIKTILNGYALGCEVTPVYNGQYMWIEAGLHINVEKLDTDLDPRIALKYAKEEKEVLAKWYDKISEIENFAIWGAASKGVTFCLMINTIAKGNNLIGCAIDVNTAKQGCFLPVTGIPIVSPEEASLMGVETILVMNPNYVKEIEKLIFNLDWKPNILNFE